MTIEEKAKRYDEAIEIARALNNGKHIDTPSGTTVCECIFPEIKELSDEKIREWLIGYFNQYIIDGMPVVFGNGLNVRDIIAWLQKQSEQKSNPYNGVSFEYNGHIWGMCARDGGVEIGYDKQLIASINPIREKNEFDDCIKVIDNKLTGCNTLDFIISIPSNYGI